MRDVARRALIMVCSGLTLSCDRQSAPTEPTDPSAPTSSKLVPSNAAAVVSRQPVGFALVSTDLERGLTALVTSGPSVLINCGSGVFSEQTDLLTVVTPNGVAHNRLLGRNLSVGVWLEPFANTCSRPFAVGKGGATLVSKDLARVGRGASVLTWHARGTVTALEGAQRYRLVITIHSVQRPDGTLRANRTDIRLIPVGH
jgi:hypothetical protein